MNEQNRKAFLDMIAFSEGTSRIPHSDDGYRVIVGGTVFKSYADHPNQLVTLNDHLKSTAAGRYQILAGYFKAYKKQLNLPDFSPASQDAVALQMIKECRALDDIDAGRFDTAVFKCKSRWASLPGAGYGQREVAIAELKKAYTDAGGSIA